MTIRERYNIRIARWKEYKACAAYYRDVKKILAQAEEEITAILDENQVDDTYACIKRYPKNVIETDLFEIDDKRWNVYGKWQTKHCHRFQEKPCSIFNCPYYVQNRRYRNMQLLLEHARSNKDYARKQVFAKIK
ncbi:MAG: hypothetical protein J6W40_03450 [Alphaproteobacteria bacterium]|nr:hypothetical protein [Alphaproteobacteria bacterium]